MYVQILIIKQLGLLFGGERVLKSAFPLQGHRSELQGGH